MPTPTANDEAAILRLLAGRDAIAPELRLVFHEEADEHLRTLCAGLARLRSEPADPTPWQEIRRAAHTLKGAAGAVGLAVVSQLAHRMEDLLDGLAEGAVTADSDSIGLLLASTDALQDLVAGEAPAEVLAAQVASLLARYPAPAESSAAAPAAADTVVTLGEPRQFDQSPGVDASGDPRVTPAAKAGSGRTLRVPLERLESLGGVVSELILNGGGWESRVEAVGDMLDELKPVLTRLQGLSDELDSRHGLAALRQSSRNLLGADHRGEFDPLEFDRYSELHILARTLAESTCDVQAVAGELRSLTHELHSLLHRQRRLTRDLGERITGLRVVPLSQIVPRLERTVRAAASQLGKQVELRIEGERTELDKSVLEELADPLLHLLRNAVDHGVETPADRVATGKPPGATVTLAAEQRGNHVVVRVRDDGRGIDWERIRERAVRDGLVGAEQAERLSARELQRFLFRPGFSTASRVTEISGRGVGMDVVQEVVRRLRGTIDVVSQLGTGTTWTVQLPSSLSVSRALIVSAGGRTLALPLAAVEQVQRIDAEEIEWRDNAPHLLRGGEPRPVRTLDDWLASRSGDQRGATALWIQDGEACFALLVDRVQGARDIVIKPIHGPLRELPGLVGATLLGDGAVAPVIDPLRLGDSNGAEEELWEGDYDDLAAPTQIVPVVMIVDDSVSVRRVTANLIRAAGWQPETAKDGVDAIEQLTGLERAPDAFLLDVEMPRMDGYDLLGAIRDMPEHRDTPILMITSRAGDKHRRKALDLGATDFVVKPFQEEALLRTLRRLLARNPLFAGVRRTGAHFT